MQCYWSPPIPVREPAEGNSLPVVTSWVRDKKWKIPKELWDKASYLYTNPTTLLLHCKSFLKLSLVPWLFFYKTVEAGGKQLFLLNVEPTALIPKTA